MRILPQYLSLHFRMSLSSSARMLMPSIFMAAMTTYFGTGWTSSMLASFGKIGLSEQTLRAPVYSLHHTGHVIGDNVSTGLACYQLSLSLILTLNLGRMIHVGQLTGKLQKTS